jgi:hypothetical protein
VRPQPPALAAPAEAAGGEASELVARLPAESRRCVALSPLRVGAEQRALVAPLSQAPALPWTLALPVSAYARAEIEGSGGRRESVELVRFAHGDRARIRAELTRADSRPLVWEDAEPGQPGPPCADELGCAAVGARFVDARTVQLSMPPVLAAYEPGGGPCLPLLLQAPDAIEVAARNDALLGSSHVATESYLYAAVESPLARPRARFDTRAPPERLVRVLRHRFQDEAAAQQALARALSGEEDAPSLASSLVEAQRRRLGEWLELRSTVSFEELALGLADQERLRSALRVDPAGRAAAPLPDESDAEAVRAFVDAQLPALADAAREPQRRAQLDDLLQRALRVHPDDDGLSKRLFELRVRQAPAGALELADQALGATRGEPAYWQLARRRALLALSAKRYRAELQKSFGLSVRAAAQMADEVARKVARAADHERAEWAFLTARNLCQRGQRGALVQRVHGSPRLPLAELPRLLVYLARLSGERDQQAFGVRILARGSDAGSGQAGTDTWSEESSGCGGGHGRVLAAASFEDAPLLHQGGLLAQHFPEGELELLVAIDALEPGGGEGPILRMRGRVAAGTFTLHEVGRALREVRWPLVERYLLAPLSALRGSLFPPDEWAVEADSSELALSMLASARAESGASCASDGLVVRCRGSFSDPRAAARALRRAAFAVLGKDSRALWSGAD